MRVRACVCVRVCVCVRAHARARARNDERDELTIVCKDKILRFINTLIIY